MTTAPTLPAGGSPPSARGARATPRRHPKTVWGAIVLYRFLRGYLKYHRTGSTPPQAYADMRRLFRMTNGRFNDLVARVERIRHPARRLPSRSGVLGNLGGAALGQIADTLRRDGVHRFNVRLPEDVCERLRRLARTAPCRVYPKPASGPDVVRYDATDWVGTRYDIDPQQLHEHPDIQRLTTDLSLLSVAQTYLGSQPGLIDCCMWWSTAFSQQPSDEAAQLFHFDMSQIRFLKIFVYLTEVDELTGAHVYVRGSHRRLPRCLRADRRYGDQEIRRHYAADRIVTICGRPGSIFAADTRGLHKGNPLKHGHRLIIQLLYATSGFGERLPPIRLNEHFSPEFLRMVKGYPYTYRRFGYPSAHEKLRA